MLDYDRNQAVVFDKGGQEEVKGPLTPTGRNEDLGEKRILGILCQGKEYTWETFQKSEIQLQRWLPRDPSVRVPLLEVEYLTDSTGALLGMRVRVVSKLEPVSELPASLFEPPPGLKVVEIPAVE